MKKSFVSISIVLLMCLFAGFTSIDANATTVATFATPSNDSNNPLFTVDFTQGKLTGGWSDDNIGLILEIPYSDYTIEGGNAFHDAWFKMDEVKITSTYMIFGVKVGETEGGVINFYADGTTANPLLTISFERGLVSRYNLGSGDTDEEGTFVAENVTISGIGITPGSLTDESFSFGFVKKTLLPGGNTLDDGFTATAAFDSSATVIPEPATICLLGLGTLSLIRRKK